ncbi:MAG: CPBP family intramembrane glutamic endopeptidase [Gemmatirosa sp.]
MTVPDPAPASGGLLDAIVLPDAARGPSARERGGAGLWLRRLGALLFWGVVQGVFLIPRLPPSTGFFVPPAAGAALNLAIAAGFVWWFAWRRAARADRRRAATFRLRPIPSAAAPWLVPASLAMVSVVVAGLLVLPRFLPIPPDKTTFLDAYLREPLGPVAVFVMVALIAPLLEEFLFRGWMQRSLERRTTARNAIVVTALTFGAIHLDLFGLPLRVAFGLASGYLAWRTRSIWPSVVLHGAYNGSLVLLGGALPQVDERMLEGWSRTDAIFYPALVGLVLAGGTLAWAVRGMGDAADHARALRRHR